MNYLEKLNAETPTRFWINNPTLAEIRKSLDYAVYACTTNPAHCAKILQTDPVYMRSVIRAVLDGGASLEEAPERVYHATCGDLMKEFLALYEKRGGDGGFVTVQEDPRREEDHDYILAASLRANKLAKNHMAKIPVTVHGMKVNDAMVARDIPICATEIFAISQATALCDLYEASAKRHGKRPKMFVTHITGIMDQYFADVAKKENIAISPEALKLAGTAVALKQYRLFRERKVQCAILGGGVRDLCHFTNFVGGDLHITINWSTAEELLALDKPLESKIDMEIPKAIIDELLEKLPNFRRSYEEGAMEPAEFADYGPVMLFRTMFMNGYSRLVDEIRIMAKRGR